MPGALGLLDHGIGKEGISAAVTAQHGVETDPAARSKAGLGKELEWDRRGMLIPLGLDNCQSVVKRRRDSRAQPLHETGISDLDRI